MKDLIKKLTEAYGPSGFEDGIRDMVRAEIEGHVDELSVDAMGNLVAFKKGDGTGRKVMIAAHLDEIGVMVTHITEKGYLRFTNIGGVHAKTLLGSRVQFADGTIGVIYSDKNGDRHKVLPIDKHYIDVGASSREDCPVQVGDAAGFVDTFFENGNRIVAKSMDDRIGVVMGIEILRAGYRPMHDLYMVFSVQEEVGVRGAQAAANYIQPEVGIAIDVTSTGDMLNGPEMAVDLGKGPAIKAKDSGMISHVGLVRLMKKRAADAGIPYQIEVLVGGSTDARAMQLAGPGSIAGCVSVPCRYVHSRSETADIRDVENGIKLFREILTKPIDL